MLSSCWMLVCCWSEKERIGLSCSKMWGRERTRIFTAFYIARGKSSEQNGINHPHWSKIRTAMVKINLALKNNLKFFLLHLPTRVGFLLHRLFFVPYFLLGVKCTFLIPNDKFTLCVCACLWFDSEVEINLLLESGADLSHTPSIVTFGILWQELLINFFTKRRNSWRCFHLSNIFSKHTTRCLE